MRSQALALALFAALASISAPAAAAPFDYEAGELRLDLGTLPPVIFTGTGVGTLNGSGGPGHLDSLTLAGGITGSTVIPVTDPVVTVGGIVSIVANATLGAGVLGPVSGAIAGTTPGLTQNTLPVQGMAKLCLFYAGCTSGSIDLDFTANGTQGFGLGGVVTAGGGGTMRISVLAAPWTVGQVTVSNRTNNGGTSLLTAAGFAHGPASLTSSTAVTSGVVQFVTPLQITTVGIPGNNDLIGATSHLRLHFSLVPEPGMLLMFGAGAIAAAVLGRRRIRR